MIKTRAEETDPHQNTTKPLRIRLNLQGIEKERLLDLVRDHGFTPGKIAHKLLAEALHLAAHGR